MKKQKNNLYRIFGINNVLAVLRSNKFLIHKVIIQKNGLAEKSDIILNLIKSSDVQLQLIQKQNFRKIYNGIRSQGVVVEFTGNIISKTLPKFSHKKSMCLLALDHIKDPQNLGQIIRTAECSGINGILLPKHHTAPVTNTVLQVSQGAFVNMNLYEVINLKQTLSRLKKDGFWIIGIENDISAKYWNEIDYTGNIVIVIGSEGRGVRKKVIESCDFIGTIPMQGNINSLNVSAAVATILFERLRQIIEK